MADEDICKTTIITPFGMFEFLRLPFGLRNAGNTFQRMMDSILGDLPYCFTYVDDILVFSTSLEQHVDHLRQVLLLCQQHGLTIGLPKCEFAVPEIEFLGHVLSANGCSPLVKHTAAISEFPTPSDKPALQRFLGMINFYRKFLQGAARVLAPLTDALKGPGKSITWTPNLEAAFRHAKDLIIRVPELIHPHSSAPISLALDASDSHVAAVLQQRVDEAWFPLAFFSRKLSDTEKKYSAFDRKLLAAYLSIRHLRFMLEGREFLLFTDHKPLTSALFRSSPPWSARQQRHLAYIAEFTSSIVHVPGLENTSADVLSRPSHTPPVDPFPVVPSGSSSPTSPSLLQTSTSSPPHAPDPPTRDPVPAVSVVSEVSAMSAVSEVLAVLAVSAVSAVTDPHPSPQSINQSTSQDFSIPGFNFSEISTLQKTCSAVQAMKDLPSLSIVNIILDSKEVLICDNSTEKLRPLVPESLRKPLFLALHSISHPGVRGSRRLVSARFVWPGLSRDVTVWAKSCLQCQRSKIQGHVKTSVPAIPVPLRRFSHVHIDIVGPLPSSQGYSYLLTMINRTTRWPEAVPLSSISTEACVRAFISSWVSRFGVPATLTSDRGSQFTSSVWARVCRVLGISTSQTTSFHPQSNGMIERFHRSLKSSLRARAADSDWVSHLPLVLLGLRSVPKEDTGFSVSEAVYESPLTIPGEFLDTPEIPSSQFISKVEKVIAGFSTPPPHHVQHSPSVEVPAALQTAKFVFVREDASKPSLSPLYRGPYLVIGVNSSTSRLVPKWTQFL